jgi:rfaE bifunctional protein kinase chain/domain
MKGLDAQKIRKVIGKFKNKRVLVLGDIMLDKYIWGDVSRISPEAPVPVVEVKRSTSCLGGAGNVCRNLESLGAFPLAVGVVGEDDEAAWVKSHLPDSRGIFSDPRRPTCIKTRIIAHQQQVVRVDQERKSPLSSKQAEAMMRFIELEDYDGIIISDYNKGVITRKLMTALLAFAKKKKKPVFVDPKIENFTLFSPVTLVTPNHHEAERIIHHECADDSQIERAGKKIFQKIAARNIIIKRGEKGMSVFEKEGKVIHIPSIAREVFDVSGAGDTVIATASLALLSGATIFEAAHLANTAAGIVVGKLGTATVSSRELLSSL